MFPLQIDFSSFSFLSLVFPKMQLWRTNSLHPAYASTYFAEPQRFLGRYRLIHLFLENLQILNEGQLPLNITGFTLEPADAPFATELSAVMVERESSVDIVIHFRPTQEGIFEATLTVLHDASNDDTPQTVVLRGTGSTDVCTTCDGKNR